MTLYEKLRDAKHGDRFRVRGVGGGAEFTISVRASAAFPMVKGYGVIPVGRKRVLPSGHRMIDAAVLEQWAEGLEEIPQPEGN